MDEPVADLSSHHFLYVLVGAALMASVGLLVVASWLVAPAWAVAALLALWLMAAVASLVGWRSRPWLPMLAALGVAAVWVILLAVGTSALGWRA